MKTLLILRHAKSSWKDGSLADHERPLNQRGRADAPRMGALLRAEGLAPDLILSSTAARARETARLAAEECGFGGDIELREAFYPGDPEDYLQALGELSGDHEIVMVVGHNPGLEELLEVLTGEYQRLPTATLARIDLPVASWAELDEEVEGKLIDLWRPKEI